MANPNNFSPEQQLAFDKYVSGENIFITGPGGSGKSYLIKKIASHAKKNGKRYQFGNDWLCCDSFELWR